MNLTNQFEQLRQEQRSPLEELLKGMKQAELDAYERERAAKLAPRVPTKGRIKVGRNWVEVWSK